MSVHTFKHEAMATWFEARIAGEDETYAKQAAQEAFSRLDRLESLLSRYREESEITQIRMLAEGEALQLSRATFECLMIAMEMAEMTGGAFQPGLGASMDAIRSTRAVAGADAGMPPGRLEIDPESLTVVRVGGPVDLDLGAIGKGFALDRLAEDFREWEIGGVMLVAGGSSILALDPPPESEGWEVRVNGTHRLLLRDSSIGASGTGVKGAHILNAQTGKPIETGARAWAWAREAARSDALSTAFLTFSWARIEAFCAENAEVGAIYVPKDGAALRTAGLPAECDLQKIS